MNWSRPRINLKPEPTTAKTLLAAKWHNEQKLKLQKAATDLDPRRIKRITKEDYARHHSTRIIGRNYHHALEVYNHCRNNGLKFDWNIIH